MRRTSPIRPSGTEPRRRRQPAALTALAIAGLALAVDSMVGGQTPQTAPRPLPARDAERLARRTCSTCHLFPPPDTLPRSAWRPAIEKMATIAAGGTMPAWGEARPKTTLSSDYASILAYYERASPEALAAPEAWPAIDAEPRFIASPPIRFAGALTQEPAIAAITAIDLDGNGTVEAVASDMRQGVVLVSAPHDPSLGAATLAALPHPARISFADLDQDGRRDLLVGDLGEFLPGDHEKGAAVWLRSLGAGGYSTFALRGFPRVAGVDAADFDRDGTLDLVVAAFGWLKRGEIALLLNRTTDWSKPSFSRATVDPRPGALQAQPIDLDRDGRMDIVAAFGQEHEEVAAYLGDGAGGFTRHTLYRAPHPNWGTTGMQIVDLDRDGDDDILVTNGDMFDDDVLKPYHGMQWLENRTERTGRAPARLRFEAHAIATLAGVHRALAADLDGDGDLDVAAAAFTGAAAGGAKQPLPSLVWLEHTSRGRFVKHTIETGNPRHAALEVADVDGDGDADLITGTLSLRGTSETWLDVWLNRTRR